MYAQTHASQSALGHLSLHEIEEIEFWTTVSEADLAYWSDYKINGLSDYYVEFTAD